ncbi:NAD-dependent succinate-semialdehyde dehydrogenase [Pseudahrensia aquimaris]|uniref:NAD-dependent succinate-semialdehyde dehydrogenase n=1 Tax=Pseudahrensia aquimaris TaxID=744461 RepID=A0ABW3FDE8_9HYPH
MKSQNPFTLEIEFSHEEMSDQAVSDALYRADIAFQDWRWRSFEDRAVVLNKAADLLDERRDRLAEIATREMGKRLSEAVSEVEKCAWVCRHYAEHAQAYLSDDQRDSDKDESYVRYFPLGVILAVMPWNFPFWQVFRFAAPTLMAGNVGLLKHASNVPQCAVEIERIFTDAGAPRGVFTTLMIGSSKVADVIANPVVKATSVTGSGPAGSAVAAQSGDEVKPSLLELGGSDPFIVMPSADIEKAVTTAVTARMINNGQSCIAAKRFIAHADIFDDFRDRFVEKVAAMKMGDPMKDGTDMGPLATQDIRNELAEQVEKSVKAGAKVLVGGGKGEMDGHFYQPTILTDIPDNSPAATEEFFGPVALLFKADSAQHAIVIANDSKFGLASSVWTTEPAEQDLFINRIEAGSTFVNSMSASDPRLPFGGIKVSGYGRELSREGILAFVNAKTIGITKG